MKNLGSGFIAWLAKSAVTAIICVVLVGISAASSYAAQFSASGTFTYTSGTGPGPLSFNWTSSNFICNGPSFGADSANVASLTATTMVWTDNMTWTRSSGTAGDITGTWTTTDPGSGNNTYTAIFNSNGTVSAIGSVSQCSSYGVPTISTISPGSGMAGNLVTISGSNFSPIKSDNSVLFNGTQAVVTDVRYGTLYAVVPAGATSGTISVTNSGGTAASSQTFTVSPGNAPATLNWGGVHHRIGSDGVEYDALDAGITSYASTLAGMSLTVAGPNGFNYVFTDADINPNTNGQLAVYRKSNTAPAITQTPGIYTFTLNDGQGHISHRVDTHITVPKPVPQVDSATIQLQRTSLSGSYRFSWAALNDTQTYFYRLRITRNDSAGTDVYASVRDMSTFVDLPAGILFDDSMYRVRVEAFDSPNADLTFNRSDSAWKQFSPKQAEYNANRLLTGYAAVYNRTNGTGTRTVDVALGVSVPENVTSLITLTGPAGFAPSTIDPATNFSNRTTNGTIAIKDFFRSFSAATVMPAGLYTFTYQTALGGTQTAYATLTTPVTYPVVDSATMQAQDLGTGNIRFSWANVNHTGALYYRVVLNNSTKALSYNGSRQNQTFVDIPASIITNLAPNQWRVELYDGDDATVQRNRFDTAYIPLVYPAYNAAVPVINSFRFRNLTNAAGAAYSHISVNVSASQSTLTQILVTRPDATSFDLLAVGRFSPANGAYTIEQPGTLAPGRYTVTVTDTANRSATRYMSVPAAHPLPRPDFRVVHNDLEPNGDMRISWAPVVSDVPVWYQINMYAQADLNSDGLIDPVYTSPTPVQQTSILIPAATLALMPMPAMAQVTAFDGSHFSVISNASRSVVVGAEIPGFNYATLVDADNDGYAGDVDANDGNAAVYPFSAGNDGLATEVTGTNPANSATNIATSGSTFSVTFNKVIDQRTLPTAFTVNNGVTGAVTYNPATRTVTLIPTSSLLSGTTYTATISTALHDQAGNALGAPFSWSFTTAGSLPSLAVTITGAGNVNSDVGNPGIHGSTPGTFTSPYAWNTPVTLTATPSTGFDFGGWGGDGTCLGSSPVCNLTMDAQAKNVTASFTVQQNIKNGSIYYATIVSAFASQLLLNDTLLLKSMTFVENPVFNVPGVAVTLKGGFVDPGFTDNSGTSIVDGTLTIQRGTVSVQKVTIR